MNIILASTSPRRQELLKNAGIEFDVVPVAIDESEHQDESPNDYLYRMVEQKADHACHLLVSAANVSERSLILTADTIAVIDQEILQKPINKAHAFAMWEKLSGTTHTISTAVCATLMVQGVIQKQHTIICHTEVKFITLSHAQQEHYWATGEPLDKAGAYAIQGGAMSWVESIKGSYTNVVGLPLAQTVALISQFANDSTLYH